MYGFPFLRRSRTVRNAERVRSYAKLIAHSHMRRKFSLPLYGEEHELDEMLEEIVDNFFEHDLGEKDPSPESGYNEDLYEEILRRLRCDAMSASDRETYMRVSCWIAAKSGDEDRARAAASEYEKIYGKSPEPASDARIERTYLEFRKRFRGNRRSLRDSKDLITFSPEKLTRCALPLISAFR